MIPAARVAAAIEVLADIDARRRPAADAMKDWGLAHRFAGSGDRAAISSLVYDALRKKSSSAWIMGEATPRAEILGALRQTRGLDVEAIAALFTGEGHAPPPLTRSRARASRRRRSRRRAAACGGRFSRMARAAVRGELRRRGRRRGQGAGRAGAGRPARQPPQDDARQGARRACLSQARADAALSGRPAHRHAARRARAAARRPTRPMSRAWSKCRTRARSSPRSWPKPSPACRSSTSAPAPAARRWRSPRRWKTTARSTPPTPTRAGSRRSSPGSPGRGRATSRCGAPKGPADVLADLEGRCDLVLIDAPCTGSGAWRRNPDAKWRMRPGALEQRIKDQDETLENALRFVKRGGRIVYVTCSVLRAENEDRIAAFMAAPRRPPADRRRDAGARGRPAGARRPSLALRPRLPPEPENDRHGRVLHRDASQNVRAPAVSAGWLSGRSEGRASRDRFPSGSAKRSMRHRPLRDFDLQCRRTAKAGSEVHGVGNFGWHERSASVSRLPKRFTPQPSAGRSTACRCRSKSAPIGSPRRATSRSQAYSTCVESFLVTIHRTG